MRTENAFRRAIENGDAVVGTNAATLSPTVIETLGNVGLDLV